MTMPVTDAELADRLRDVAAVLSDQKRSTDQLVTQLAAVARHRPNVLTMRRNLLRLRPWEWLRRRRIYYQLAHVALAIAEHDHPLLGTLQSAPDVDPEYHFQARQRPPSA